MKNHLIIFVFFLFVPLSLIGVQQPKHAPSPKQVTQPKTLEINMGMISTADVAFHNVKFTADIKPVTIKSIAISSTNESDTGFGIIVPDMPIVLRPHKSVTITVIFNPVVAGSDDATLTIVTTSKATPKLIVHLIATAFDPKMNFS